MPVRDQPVRVASSVRHGPSPDAGAPHLGRTHRARRHHGLRPGRVDAWRTSWRRRSTRSPSSTRTRTRSAACRADFAGTQGHRHRLRPRHPARGRHREAPHAFAAVSSGDNSNILAARVARETFGVENVVARIYDPGRAAVYQRLGIPTVATVRWTADQMLRRLLPEGAETGVARPVAARSALAEVHVTRRLGRPARWPRWRTPRAPASRS